MKYLFMALITVAGFLIFSTVPQAGDYYQYRDQKGVLIFTDSLSDVPPDQRKQVKRFKDLSEKQGAGSTKAPGLSPAQEQKTGPEKPPPRSSLQALKMEKKALEKRYDQLLNRRNALAKEETRGRTSREVLEFQKKIDALNADINAYEKQRAAFEKKRKELEKSP